LSRSRRLWGLAVALGFLSLLGLVGWAESGANLGGVSVSDLRQGWLYLARDWLDPILGRTLHQYGGQQDRCDLVQSVEGPPQMVWVPGGAFQMGDELEPGETPIRQVETAGFWMDRTEVTNAQFSRFVEATGYVTDAERAQQQTPGQRGLVGGKVLVFSQPEAVLGRDDTSQWWVLSRQATWRQPSGLGSSIAGRDAYPVVGVTHADASAYAQWLGRALPTEVQWERAARAAKVASKGNASGELNRIPSANTWQGVFPVLDAGADGHAGIAPVACYAANVLGIHDLIGNVWEITQDPYRGSVPFNAPMAMPADPSGAMSRLKSPGPTSGAHVIKGGSFLCSEDYCSRARAGSRQPLEDGMAAVHIGFRTVAADPSPQSELRTGKAFPAVAQ